MRRKKMYFIDIVEQNISYYGYARITYKGAKCWLYKLDKPLTNEQTDFVKQFNNVDFVIVKSEYAPEQKVKGLIIYDKQVKHNKE